MTRLIVTLLLLGGVAGQDESYWRARSVMTMRLRLGVTPVTPDVPDHVECGCEGTKRSGDGLGPCPCIANGGVCRCPVRRLDPPVPKMHEAVPVALKKWRSRGVLYTDRKLCKWCITMDKETLPQLVTDGWLVGKGPEQHLQVVEIPLDKAGSLGFKSLPAVIVLDEFGKETRRHYGFLNADGVGRLIRGEAIRGEDQRVVPKGSRKGVETPQPFRRGAYAAAWTFPGRTAADLRWHLIHEHGYSEGQVSRMSFDDMLRLHDSAHGSVENYRWRRM